MNPHVANPRAPLPVLRAAVFAVVGAVLGVSAHHLLGAESVPWAQGATVAAGLFGLGLVGVRRPRHVGTVVVCSVAGQSGLHLWLTLTAHPPRGPHVHHHGHTPVREPLHGSVAMTAAHALVAVLVAVLLHRADMACWTLARGVGRVLGSVRDHVAAARALFTWPPPAGRLGVPVPPAAEDARTAPMGPVLAYAVVRRGPPPGRAVLVT
ncbi:hypothetical protein OG866_40995 [Streptomyces sp. NBC_00663]|uniref:hypothetical protein n=1 Tax=Streptomyces sp. NBC_00663 TaxID=2975801 RepID=UPI002E330629|nr:hypothetical protein [Streptomyces sp. NBC_00663]